MDATGDGTRRAALLHAARPDRGSARTRPRAPIAGYAPQGRLRVAPARARPRRAFAGTAVA